MMDETLGAAGLRRTPFYDMHKLLGARLVPFVGWEMPVQYNGIVQEHLCVRNSCGLFDVSHMGEVFITGADAWKEVQRLVTNDLDKIGDRRVIYSPMCYESGGIVDDLLIYQFSREKFMLIVNASNARKDFGWMKEKISGVAVEDRSDDYAQLALQGPKAETALQALTDYDLASMESFHFDTIKVAGAEMIVSRTGYTGEDGFELYFQPDSAEKVWNEIMNAGKPFGIMPIGLGARDTLRLEAGLMLYGNDIDENTTPLEAPLKWTVSFKKDFIGSNALKETPPRKKLFGFELVDRGVPRHGNEVVSGGRKIGDVTSGTFSPSFKKPIGLCFLPPDHPGSEEIGINIHDKVCRAKLTSTRFYRRGVK